MGVKPLSDTSISLVIGAGPYVSLDGGPRKGSTGSRAMVVGTADGLLARPHARAVCILRSGLGLASGRSGGVAHAPGVPSKNTRSVKQQLDPIPAPDWFQDYCRLVPRSTERVSRYATRSSTNVDKLNGRFEATLASGLAHPRGRPRLLPPGIRHYTISSRLGRLPPRQAWEHTPAISCASRSSRARVCLIVGGRQSAYEWAALIREHGAERIDVVHRHAVPRFERVSWKFVDTHVDNTTKIPGYWRNLPPQEQERIGRQFWEVGRLTLEHWLIPRLEWEGIHRWPGIEVVDVALSDSGDQLRVALSNSEQLTVDRVVFASGYRADLTRVPYLASVVEEIELSDGFPVLNEFFASTIANLYITGFSATHDFGPFFGFVKASPAAATLIVRDLMSRN